MLRWVIALTALVHCLPMVHNLGGREQTAASAAAGGLAVRSAMRELPHSRGGCPRMRVQVFVEVLVQLAECLSGSFPTRTCVDSHGSGGHVVPTTVATQVTSATACAGPECAQCAQAWVCLRFVRVGADVGLWAQSERSGVSEAHRPQEHACDHVCMSLVSAWVDGGLMTAPPQYVCNDPSG